MDTPIPGTEDVVTPPTNGRPVLVGAEEPVVTTEPTPVVAAPKRRGRPPKVRTEAEVSAQPKTRKRPTAENIAQLKAWKAEGRTLAEIHTLSGFSVGSIRKYTGTDLGPRPAKRGRPPKAKVQAAPKARRGRPPKAAATPVAAPPRLDTVTQVKVMLFDLIRDGHSIAAIRGALASLPV